MATHSQPHITLRGRDSEKHRRTSTSMATTTGKASTNWHSRHPSSQDINTSPQPRVQISAFTTHPTAYQKRTSCLQAQRRTICCQCTLFRCQRCRGSVMFPLHAHHRQFVPDQGTADLILRMVESNTHSTQTRSTQDKAEDKDRKELTYFYISPHHHHQPSQEETGSQAETHSSQLTHTLNPSPTHSSALRQ